MNEIRQEIEKIAASAEKLKSLAGSNMFLARNAEIILTFVYLLRFGTPSTDKEN